MQKRFCSCGHLIFVRYHRRMGVWQPEVINSKQPRKPHPECPACGAPVSIHSLH